MTTLIFLITWSLVDPNWAAAQLFHEGKKACEAKAESINNRAATIAAKCIEVIIP